MSSRLGDFLRLRRGQVRVHDGASRGLRRTPGLRREEVAVAAAVSVDYYTRLEQGREVNPSDAVLASLAVALGLTDDDLAHARALRDGGNGGRAEMRQDEAQGLSQRMRALVQAWEPRPAYVLSFCSDVVAANAQAYALFRGLDDPDEAPPNTCRYLLTHPIARERFVNWEEVARASVASLREHSAVRAGDPQLEQLTAELTRRSPEFRRWWDEHVVAPRRSASKVFRCQDGSTFTLPYEVLLVPRSELRLTVYLGEVGDYR